MIAFDLIVHRIWYKLPTSTSRVREILGFVLHTRDTRGTFQGKEFPIFAKLYDQNLYLK